MTKTILIRINPASNGYSLVLTNHNIPGTENRKEVVKTTFEEVQSSVAEFLTQVAETDAEQEAEKAKTTKPETNQNG
jgi:hypothetical protein